MLHFFRIAIFLGASLLFLVQPMFAKIVLPLLGGSPAVWNTCMLFFQGMLLVGYAYAHATHRLIGIKTQVIVHMAVLIAILFLPVISLPENWSPPSGSSPVFWLLGLLFVVVGGPFFAVSATSPLLQQWFAETDHARAGNPYFLYSASNLGSIVALLSYPFLIERLLSLDVQAVSWKYAYSAFVLAMGVCGCFVWKSKRGSSVEATDGHREHGSDAVHVNVSSMDRTQTRSADEAISWPKRLLWIGLSFVPSSWMLGVTTFLSTDISPMPILWIIPLSIYLITFIIAFADQPIIRYAWVSRAFPIAMLTLAATVIFKGGMPIMALHLAVFFIGAMACHLELARNKPSPKHLTEFYFWVSFGGLLGGIFNGLVAPIFFPWILEYPITLMMACLLRPTFAASETNAAIQNNFKQNSNRDKSLSQATTKKNSKTNKPLRRDRKKAEQSRRNDSSLLGEKLDNETLENDATDADLERKIRLGMFLIFGVTLAVMVQLFEFQGTLLLTISAIASLALLSLLYFLNRPIWFAVPLVFLFVLAQLEPPQAGETVLFTQRGFFGVNRVVDGPDGMQKRLYHGKTIHGLQTTDPDRQELYLEPTSYYHRAGPLGEIFKFAQQAKPFEQVAIVGLGAGTAACYRKADQFFTFYEIDPIVQQIAENPKHFSFLNNCGIDNYKIVLGDGRYRLSEATDGKYDLIVFDAFSSDAIPMHLLTREAIESYKLKLSSRGFMAFHISNQFFDLEPILGDLARASDLQSVVFHDLELSEEDLDTGKAAASYVVLAKDLSVTGLNGKSNWAPTRQSDRGVPWTDDFSNPLDAMK